MDYEMAYLSAGQISKRTNLRGKKVGDSIPFGEVHGRPSQEEMAFLVPEAPGNGGVAFEVVRSVLGLWPEPLFQNLLRTERRKAAKRQKH